MINHREKYLIILHILRISLVSSSTHYHSSFKRDHALKNDDDVPLLYISKFCQKDEYG